MTVVAKIAFFICLFFLCFVNFEGIIESLFYGPEKTYQLALRYESKKNTELTNVSLFESFSMEFLQNSEKKLKFIELLNLDAYNLNMNKLFEGISPITEIYLIPWKLNHSNIEAFVVSVNHSLVADVYRTTVRLFQFDDDQEVAFQPFEQIELEGKPVRTFQGNESVHLEIANPHSNHLISVIPENLLK
jgi:hypothetical protein